jgi:uncharacterized protein YbjQ (UPF0145 family)
MLVTTPNVPGREIAEVPGIVSASGTAVRLR